ncbi:MAG: hypothetical protein F4093_00265 [Gammaproteobacteria bacterium]|nr:hypothetical protein [Gammaproteobacteria bacterium]
MSDRESRQSGDVLPGAGAVAVEEIVPDDSEPLVLSPEDRVDQEPLQAIRIEHPPAKRQTYTGSRLTAIGCVMLFLLSAGLSVAYILAEREMVREHVGVTGAVLQLKESEAAFRDVLEKVAASPGRSLVDGLVAANGEMSAAMRRLSGLRLADPIGRNLESLNETWGSIAEAVPKLADQADVVIRAREQVDRVGPALKTYRDGLEWLRLRPEFPDSDLAGEREERLEMLELTIDRIADNIYRVLSADDPKRGIHLLKRDSRSIRDLRLMISEAGDGTRPSLGELRAARAVLLAAIDFLDRHHGELAGYFGRVGIVLEQSRDAGRQIDDLVRASIGAFGSRGMTDSPLAGIPPHTLAILGTAALVSVLLLALVCLAAIRENTSLTWAIPARQDGLAADSGNEKRSPVPVEPVIGVADDQWAVGNVVASLDRATVELYRLARRLKTAIIELDKVVESAIPVPEPAMGGDVLDAAITVPDGESVAGRIGGAGVLAELVQRCRKSVRDAAGGIDAIREQVEESEYRITRLGESARQFGDLVLTIQDITEQARVLSLNASIQAAAAGEPGRGDSAVAEEMKKLSEQALRACRQITGIAGSIEKDVGVATTSMEAAGQEIEAGVSASDLAIRDMEKIDRMSREYPESISAIEGGARSDIRPIEAAVEMLDSFRHSYRELDDALSRIIGMLDGIRSDAARLGRHAGSSGPRGGEPSRDSTLPS